MTDNLELIRQARNLAKQKGPQDREFLVTRIETGYPPIGFKGSAWWGFANIAAQRRR